MYAIEAKKRKFDRILETIKDHASLPPAPTATTSHNGMNSVVKRRRLDVSAMSSKSSKSVAASSTPRTANYLPASREAFLERLETFGPITKWHVPSTEDISAAAWAKRGWCCVDTDLVGCKTCNEHLLVKLDVEEEPRTIGGAVPDDERDDDDVNTTAMLRHRLLVEKYSGMISSAHAFSCPWRNRGCDNSIQRISGLFNRASTLQTLKARYDSLRNFEIPSVHLSSEESLDPVQEIPDFRFDTGPPEEPHQDTLRLAICGWQASPGREDVAECRACFRSLGLWLYRGEQPIVEKLDAVESHLEYCPWRSALSQSTMVGCQGEKRMVPAWVLVTRTMKEGVGHPSANGATERQHEEREELGEKERETKVKDLLRRVKELKKPFNVKALLRKKAAAG